MSERTDEGRRDSIIILFAGLVSSVFHSGGVTKVYMDTLVRALRTFEATTAIPDVDGDDTYMLHSSDHPLVDVIKSLACDVLITESGYPNFSAIDTLWHEHQYFITPGEKDSIGWLTACLHTKKGTIVFG